MLVNVQILVDVNYTDAVQPPAMNRRLYHKQTRQDTWNLTTYDSSRRFSLVSEEPKNGSGGNIMRVMPFKRHLLRRKIHYSNQAITLDSRNRIVVQMQFRKYVATRT